MPAFNFRCEKCNHAWAEHLDYMDYDLPEEEPCISCGYVGFVKHVMTPKKLNEVIREKNIQDQTLLES
jgi:hypothetical protein